MSKLDVICPDRTNTYLGEGWSWSDRHLLRVINEPYVIYVSGNYLWFDVRGANLGSVRFPSVNLSSGVDHPVLKMVLITRSTEAIDQCIERFDGDEE